MTWQEVPGRARTRCGPASTSGLPRTGAGAHGQRPGRGSHRGGHELGPGGDGAGDRGRGQYDPYTGYDITNPKNRFLNEIFKGTNRTAAPNKLLLYRLGATGQKQASAEVSPLTATAKYPGVRGNDISIVITELTDLEDAFAVSTVVGGEIVDQQTAKTVEELSANDWVAWSGTGALAATVGKALSGGADGSPASADYTDFLAAIEPYKFDVLIYDGTDTTVQDAMVAFVAPGGGGGAYTQLVAAGLTNPDDRFVVNIMSGVVLSDGTTLTPSR
ncbi:hypothetical protein M5E87_20270 [Flavonifractor plautii]|nr:hypothetical protein M5E87_20270 [Flavonifractor plautii]